MEEKENNPLSDTSTWPKEKDEVVRSFISFLMLNGAKIATAVDLGLLGGGGKPIIQNNFSGGGGIGGNPVAVMSIGAMAVIYGFILGMELGQREADIVQNINRILGEMTNSAGERKGMTNEIIALGGFDAVTSMATQEISTLIKAWDLAE